MCKSVAPLSLFLVAFCYRSLRASPHMYIVICIIHTGSRLYTLLYTYLHHQYTTRSEINISYFFSAVQANVAEHLTNHSHIDGRAIWKLVIFDLQVKSNKTGKTFFYNLNIFCRWCYCDCSLVWSLRGKLFHIQVFPSCIYTFFAAFFCNFDNRTSYSVIIGVSMWNKSF